MKRMIGALLCLILTVLPLSACTQKTEVSCEAIDRRYTAAYDSVETEYKYTYDVWKGDFVLVPYVQTVAWNSRHARGGTRFCLRPYRLCLEFYFCR